MRLPTFFICIVASNFLYQFIFQDSPNWAQAFERSYFQALALGLYYVVEWFSQRESEVE